MVGGLEIVYLYGVVLNHCDTVTVVRGGFRRMGGQELGCLESVRWFYLHVMLFGQRTQRGQSPVEHRVEFLYVRLSLRP